MDADDDRHFKYDAQLCPQGDDCDDTDPLRHPERIEDCHDTERRDEDCDDRANCEDDYCWAGQTAECDAQCDQDNDGFYKATCGVNPADCNDDCSLCYLGFGAGASGEAWGSNTCDDEKDNDCDGADKIDCSDSDCAGFPHCQPTPTPPPLPTPTPGDSACEQTNGPGWFVGLDGRTCVPPECMNCYQQGGTYCDPQGYCWTPIIIDLSGNGFDLTNGSNGVYFRPNNGDMPIRTAWTSAGSDDAFLVLDRNGNGLIDDGTELFGCSTPQPEPPLGELKNGFLALAEYDRPENGGNGNGKIGPGDGIFSELALWRDVNHNGISEPAELQRLSASEIRTIGLDYHESRRQDQHGNKFKYRARVRDRHGAQVGRWAWDVFPVVDYGEDAANVRSDILLLEPLYSDRLMLFAASFFATEQ